MQVTDTHAHVNVQQFDVDRLAMLDRAFASGVSRIICPGTDILSSESSIALAQQYPGMIFACAGIHPHDSTEFDIASLATIRALSQQEGVVAIGEIGLDYYRNYSPRDVQLQSFSAQVALAQELNLPIVMHCRDAEEDILKVLRTYPAVHGVWHCFIGDLATAEHGLAIGLYISFAGPVTYPARKDLAEVAATIPLDRILIETDSPYLAPHPNRRERNEPANVVKIAQRIADLRQIPVEDVIAATTANATAAFRLPAIPQPSNGVS